jgi:hypothetical protein
MGRRELRKLAAEMLVERSKKQLNVALPEDTAAPDPENPISYVSVEKIAPDPREDGKAKKFIKRYEVPSSEIEALEQMIDDVGTSPEEKVASTPEASTSSSPLRVDYWIENLRLQPEASEAIRKIFDENLLKDPSCANLYGSLSNQPLSPGRTKVYDKKSEQLIRDLAMFVPYSKTIAETTGKGEYALAFLFDVVPERRPGFDIVVGDREYTVKNREAGLDTFQYSFGSSGRKRTIASSQTTTKAEKAANLLGLQMRKGNQRFVSEDGRTRWALVCNATKEVFSFQAFSISNRLANLYSKEIKALDVGSQVDIGTSSIRINLKESKSLAENLVSELSRRDQEQVTAIARRIAQEVLEDELGDDFDKAVRREMAAGFKDPDVESAAADVTKAYLRKLYRSLGVSSSSPLDKVKI